ncbi:MAG TPA: hypothetical protein VGL15_14215 [Vicinamibacteria bacterium]
MKIKIPSHLTDGELTAELKRLVCDERERTVIVVAHLVEFDARRLYLGAGFPSLYMYCRGVLRMSEYESYHRIKAARAARRFPVILEKLGEASLTLATVRLLAPHLTRENHQDLIAQASGKSRRQVEELLARLFPQPDLPTRVWKLPSPDVTPAVPAVLSFDSSAAPAASETASPRTVIRPLSPGRYGMQVTLSGNTLEKLECAKDMLSHAVPSGDEAEIIDRALTALLEQLARKKFADTERPRPGRGGAFRWPYVPAKVKREVWVRDAGRCAFIADDGRRCEARRFIQFHHVIPRCKPTPDKIQLRCQAHNGYEADRYYGPSEPDRGDDFVREPAPQWQFGEEPTGPGASSGDISESAVV